MSKTASVCSRLRLFLLNPYAGAGNREQAGGGDLSLVTLVSERALAPDHRMSQGALRIVVGRLHAGIFKEREQPAAMLKQGRRQDPHLFVLAVEVLLAQAEETLLQRNGFVDQLRPTKSAAAKNTNEPPSSA